MNNLAAIAEDAKVNAGLEEDPRQCAVWTMVHLAAIQTIALESIARSLVQIAGDRENAGILPDMKTALQFLVLTDRRKED